MVHILQVLCPQRHCIIALAFMPEDRTPEQAIEDGKALIKGLVEDKALNHWCALCGGKEFSYEVGVTRYKTIEEARPHLEQHEQKMLLSRAILLSDPARQ